MLILIFVITIVVIEETVNICDWCGKPSKITRVRGHRQPFVGGITLDECRRREETRYFFKSVKDEEKDNGETD